VDPETGTPLGWEEILTADPGRLNVRVPAGPVLREGGETIAS
jgi:hypothetical protein